jgi:predicted anti-sigma-YlaC factor YlaD
VKATAGGLTRAALIAVLAAACPGLLGLSRLSVVWPAVALAGAASVLLLGSALWPRCRRALVLVTADLRAVQARPHRAAALWGGSLGFAVLHALVLIAVTRAVALPPAPPLRGVRGGGGLRRSRPPAADRVAAPALRPAGARRARAPQGAVSRMVEQRRNRPDGSNATP